MSSICMKSGDVSPNNENNRFPNRLMRFTSPSHDVGADATSFKVEWSLTVVLEAASRASAMSF